MDIRGGRIDYSLVRSPTPHPSSEVLTVPCFSHWHVIESWLGTLREPDIDWDRPGEVLGIIVNELISLKSCVSEHELGKTHPQLSAQLDALGVAMDAEWSNPLWDTNPNAAPNTDVPKDSPEYQASLVHARQLASEIYSHVDTAMRAIDAHAVFGLP
ncbi:MAG TPA: hypothetical protein VN648_12775 [Candidatus Methylomirabilis sp.]|nr:hypothetical protein [Candidatus Methylomirabilis sp.]